MATRDELYQKFGPKMVEALALVIMDEINVLREQHSLPARTAGQIVDAIDTKLQNVTNFSWMGNQ